MEGLELFDKLVKSNNIWDAHMVIKNLYNKQLGNQEVFNEYFEFLSKAASWNIELKTRKFFLNEADTALIFFSENGNITDDTLSYLNTCREKLKNITLEIAKIEQELSEKYKEKVHQENNKLLKELVDLKSKLFMTKQQKQFDTYLVEVNNKENSLIKDMLTQEQNVLYNTLTKEYSSIISNKMTELNAISLKDYNKTAVRDFKYVFDEFKGNESKYKSSHSQLFSLVSNRLFSYDASKLFNETLIYYNHVYSYIFNKLDEDGKFRITQISIDTEKLKG